MIQILILTHGSLAASLLETARTIVGDPGNIRALPLDWNESAETLREQLRAAIARFDEGEGVLILTDLFGDTPTNLALSLAGPGRVEVVTGVNLPMVLRLGCPGACRLALPELAAWIEVKGREAIRSHALLSATPGVGG